MKRLLITLSLSALVTGNAFAQNSLEIGSSIPSANVKMWSVDNSMVTLNDVKKEKKGLLVMFSCNTCPFVVKSQARTKEAIEYAMKNNIGMIIINSNEAQRTEEDSRDAMKQYSKQQSYKVPYVVDENSKLADAFGATRTPEVFLFDASGKLIYKGAMEDNPSKPAESKELFLQSAMEKMLAGSEPQPHVTKSIGCSIKRKA